MSWLVAALLAAPAAAPVAQPGAPERIHVAYEAQWRATGEAVPTGPVLIPDSSKTGYLVGKARPLDLLQVDTTLKIEAKRNIIGRRENVWDVTPTSIMVPMKSDRPIVCSLVSNRIRFEGNRTASDFACFIDRDADGDLDGYFFHTQPGDLDAQLIIGRRDLDVDVYPLTNVTWHKATRTREALEKLYTLDISAHQSCTIKTKVAQSCAMRFTLHGAFYNVSQLQSVSVDLPRAGATFGFHDFACRMAADPVKPNGTEYTVTKPFADGIYNFEREL